MNVRRAAVAALHAAIANASIYSTEEEAMPEKNSEITTEGVINGLRDNIGALQALYDSMNVKELDTWIVHISKVYCRFETIEGKEHVFTCPIREATRFDTHADATRYARRVFNGKDEGGECVMLGDAIQGAIADIQRMLEPFNKGE